MCLYRTILRNDNLMMKENIANLDIISSILYGLGRYNPCLGTERPPKTDSWV